MKEIKISDRCADNAASITISEETKALVQCRARLNDIYDNVNEILSSRLEVDSDDSFPKFKTAFFSLDDVILDIITHAIDLAMINNEFKRI